MLEIIVFVVAMAMANLITAIITTLVMPRLMFSKWFIKKYMKTVKDVAEYAVAEMYTSEEDDEVL